MAAVMPPQDEEDNPNSIHCHRFRTWQATQEGRWSDSIFVLTGCDDLSEETYFEIASKYGKHGGDDCEDASTYMQWFRDAWDHYEDDPKWRISYTDAFSWLNETDKQPEPGITPRHSESDLRGMGIRKDYPPGVVLHEVYHFIRPDLEEHEVHNWALNQAIECYDREEEEEDDDENTNNGNGNSGSGGGGGGGGGGGNNGGGTCIPDRIVWIKEEGTCEESEEEEESSCDEFHEDGYPICTLPGLTACGAENKWTSHLVEGTCSTT